MTEADSISTVAKGNGCKCTDNIHVKYSTEHQTLWYVSTRCTGDCLNALWQPAIQIPLYIVIPHFQSVSKDYIKGFSYIA